MPRIERNATVTWEGNVARGTGLISAGSGAFEEQPFSLPTRIGQAEGKTSPEELLASAHGGCLAMSLASELTTAGTPPERLDVQVRVVMDEVPGKGHLIVASNVDITARVPGLEASRFDAAVAAADAGCSFSVLIRASAAVNVEARLEGS